VLDVDSRYPAPFTVDEDALRWLQGGGDKAAGG